MLTIAVLYMAAVFLAVVLAILFVMRPKRLKLSAGLGKLFHMSIEADTREDRAALPPHEEKQ